jgi:hypothetical protein
MSQPIQQQQHLNMRSNTSTRLLYCARILASFVDKITGTSGRFLPIRMVLVNDI